MSNLIVKAVGTVLGTLLGVYYLVINLIESSTGTGYRLNTKVWYER